MTGLKRFYRDSRRYRRCKISGRYEFGNYPQKINGNIKYKNAKEIILTDEEEFIRQIDYIYI